MVQIILDNRPLNDEEKVRKSTLSMVYEDNNNNITGESTSGVWGR